MRMDVREKKKIAQARFPAVLRKRCYCVKERSSQETTDENKAEKPHFERDQESVQHDRTGQLDRAVLPDRDPSADHGEVHLYAGSVRAAAQPRCTCG